MNTQMQTGDEESSPVCGVQRDAAGRRRTADSPSDQCATAVRASSFVAGVKRDGATRASCCR